MANLHYLFQEFNTELSITNSKKTKMMESKDHLRERIRNHFEKNHDGYTPKFFIQGSYKLKTLIRTKDDLCDLDDGVYFKSNPDNVSGTTLQSWVKEAVEGVTDATPTHKKKCIRVDYKAGYNIDLPVMVYDEDIDEHPHLAVKYSDFRDDDPKEFVEYFNEHKTEQMRRIIKYLKAWCDNKREDMPCGLAMTVLSLNHYQENDRDDIALKYVLIEMEKELRWCFRCDMPTTPKDNLFEDYTDKRRDNFMANLHAFVEDAKAAIDEPNHRKASRLWRKHLGDRFPEGEDKNDQNTNNLNNTIGSSKPYFNGCQ